MPQKAIIGVVALVALGLAIYTLINRKPQSSGTLKVSGTIEVTSVALSFKIGGRMTERLVDEGQVVNAGQLVARLENNELKDL